MKKFLLFLLFVPVFIMSQTGPKLEIEEGESINTGSHMRGKELDYIINFKNTGDEDLKITAVNTSCGCSSALASSDLLKPGESGSVKFHFNGQGFGPVSKSVTISTNETDPGYHVILLTMNMVDPVILNPQSIISEGIVGDELSKTAIMTNSLDKQMDITEIVSNSPVIKITSDKMVLAPGETASLDIKIKIYEESEINAAVIIRTSEGEFQIPVLVEVKAN